MTLFECFSAHILHDLVIFWDVAIVPERRMDDVNLSDVVGWGEAHASDFLVKPNHRGLTVSRGGGGVCVQQAAVYCYAEVCRCLTLTNSHTPAAWSSGLTA